MNIINDKEAERLLTTNTIKSVAIPEFGDEVSFILENNKTLKLIVRLDYTYCYYEGDIPDRKFQWSYNG